MTKCPCCFQPLPTDRFRWTCVSGTCPQEPNGEASGYQGAPVRLGPMMELRQPSGQRGWRPPERVRCQQCSGAVAKACPICNFPLPDDWYESQAICVAMAGARHTGKSVLIGVMLHFLQDLVQGLGNALNWGNPQSRATYHEHYEKALFIEMGVLPPTAKIDTQGPYQREPLIVSLGRVDGTRRYLCLRDVAGEDLEAQVQHEVHFRFFGYADLVVFLFDPLAVPAVAQGLAGLVPTERIVRSATPKDVLNSVLRLIGNGDPAVAVVLSKFDALQEIRRLPDHPLGKVMTNMGAGIMRSSTLAGYDEQDGELVHEEVRGLLQLLNAGDIVAAVEKPDRGRPYTHRFMVVSSLGDSPRGERLGPTGIAPFQVLEPIKWVLRRSSIVPDVRAR